MSFHVWDVHTSVLHVMRFVSWMFRERRTLMSVSLNQVASAIVLDGYACTCFMVQENKECHNAK